MPGTIRGSSRSPLGAMAMLPRCLSTVSAMACRGRLPYREPPARPYPTRWLRPVTCRPDRAWQRSIGVRWSGIPAPANRPRTARASGPGGASRQGSVVSPQLGAGWGHGGRLPGLVVAAPTRPRVDGFGGRLRVGHVGGRAHHAAGYSPAGGRTGGDRNLLVAAGSAGMDVLGWILLASAVAFATKLVGYLLPHKASGRTMAPTGQHRDDHRAARRAGGHQRGGLRSAAGAGFPSAVPGGGRPRAATAGALSCWWSASEPSLPRWDAWPDCPNPAGRRAARSPRLEANETNQI